MTVNCGADQAFTVTPDTDYHVDDVLVDGRAIDSVVLDWISDIEYDEVLKISHSWISSQNFLTQRMTGLSSVGESSLTIEPLEDF
jgi:hypothetical protein